MNARHRLRRHLLRLAGRVLARVQRPDVADGNPTARLLVVRPDDLGDLLLLTPALRLLRERCPSAEITVAVREQSRAALAGNPDLDRILAIDFPGFTRSPRARRGPLAPYSYLLRSARTLRSFAFDAALIQRPDHWWGAFLAAAAGLPRCFGYALPDVAPFLTDALPPPPHEHAAATNVRLVKHATTALGSSPPQDADVNPASLPTTFTPSAGDNERATSLLAAVLSGADHRPLVAIHPSSGVPVKLWDERRLAAVADHLADEFGARIVLTGGPGDEALTAEVARHLRAPALDLAGKTTFGALGALLARCTLALGPDSGALHLAVAVGTPTVHLFGPADPVIFGPWGDPARHRVVSAGLRCPNCGNLSPTRPRGATCMLAIEVEDVLTAARPLLAEQAGR